MITENPHSTINEPLPDRLDPKVMLRAIRALNPSVGVGWEFVQDAGDVIEAMMDEIAELRGGDYDY